MRELTVIITGISHSFEIIARHQIVWADLDKKDIEIISDIINDLELSGDGFKQICSITLH